ncbi:hypothetical protein IMY05_C4668000100 [Salix suchowensis]|nr:hypothetical protein IMY05_C4668000100 [Salix suchowensis]
MDSGMDGEIGRERGREMDTHVDADGACDVNDTDGEVIRSRSTDTYTHADTASDSTNSNAHTHSDNTISDPTKPETGRAMLIPIPTDKGVELLQLPDYIPPRKDVWRELRAGDEEGDGAGADERGVVGGEGGREERGTGWGRDGCGCGCGWASCIRLLCCMSHSRCLTCSCLVLLSLSPFLPRSYLSRPLLTLPFDNTLAIYSRNTRRNLRICLSSTPHRHLQYEYQLAHQRTPHATHAATLLLPSTHAHPIDASQPPFNLSLPSPSPPPLVTLPPSTATTSPVNTSNASASTRPSRPKLTLRLDSIPEYAPLSIVSSSYPYTPSSYTPYPPSASSSYNSYPSFSLNLGVEESPLGALTPLTPMTPARPAGGGSIPCNPLITNVNPRSVMGSLRRTLVRRSMLASFRITRTPTRPVYGRDANQGGMNSGKGKQRASTGEDNDKEYVDGDCGICFEEAVRPTLTPCCARVFCAEHLDEGFFFSLLVIRFGDLGLGFRMCVFGEGVGFGIWDLGFWDEGDMDTDCWVASNGL